MRDEASTRSGGRQRMGFGVVIQCDLVQCPEVTHCPLSVFVIPFESVEFEQKWQKNRKKNSDSLRVLISSHD